ncbi:RuBisCO accumulation factor 1 [Myxosarcina sp. GI1]|uniref:RuBisCO accumulation factor 1 n=1 Tax=Myxosarcina sp. GI1 TaxID=1541065 RepID=UPI00055EFE13|nr:RuBisCO accumulation factor 1 [Myxosarcina sp. GI1]
MNNSPQNESVQLDDATARELMRSLLHKEGTWIDWGKNCQTLQKSGYSPQVIFEETGFQASQQNLIIVAAQVYDTLVKSGVNEKVLAYFRGPRSDVLYEFRVLSQQQRTAAGLLAYDKQLDVDEAHQVARVIQDVSRLSQLPEAFTNHPGDWVAYTNWKRARQKKDLQERSRLIAKGLKFAHSPTARAEIEKLLSDFTVVSAATAPLLPLYRLELEEELPRIVPLVGTYPLTRQAIETVGSVEVREPFAHIKVNEGTFVPVPGWQAVLKASDPVAYLCSSDRLPKFLTTTEEVLVIVDRASREWDINSYFLVEVEGNIELRWLEAEPSNSDSIIGQLVVVLRPKKILDENNLLEPWQMDD